MLQLGNHDHRTQVTKLVIYTASLVGNIFQESIATKNRQRLVCLLQVSYSFFPCLLVPTPTPAGKKPFKSFAKTCSEQKPWLGYYHSLTMP